MGAEGGISSWMYGGQKGYSYNIEIGEARATNGDNPRETRHGAWLQFGRSVDRTAGNCAHSAFSAEAVTIAAL